MLTFGKNSSTRINTVAFFFCIFFVINFFKKSFKKIKISVAISFSIWYNMCIINSVESRATVQRSYLGGKKYWDTYTSKASYGTSYKNNPKIGKKRRAAEYHWKSKAETFGRTQ